jgi:hypothetical protein
VNGGRGRVGLHRGGAGHGFINHETNLCMNIAGGTIEMVPPHMIHVCYARFNYTHQFHSLLETVFQQCFQRLPVIWGGVFPYKHSQSGTAYHASYMGYQEYFSNPRILVENVLKVVDKGKGELQQIFSALPAIEGKFITFEKFVSFLKKTFLGKTYEYFVGLGLDNRRVLFLIEECFSRISEHPKYSQKGLSIDLLALDGSHGGSEPSIIIRNGMDPRDCTPLVFSIYTKLLGERSSSRK